jgi:hypothetical protein
MMGNDEARMTNDEIMTMPKARNFGRAKAIASLFVRHSSFVIRHF